MERFTAASARETQRISINKSIEGHLDIIYSMIDQNAGWGHDSVSVVTGKWDSPPTDDSVDLIVAALIEDGYVVGLLEVSPPTLNISW